MSLGVSVEFNANLTKFSGQIDKMAGNLDQFQRKAEAMASRVNRSFSMLGVGISAAGLVSFVKSGIDAADALNDLSDRTSIAVEQLAGLQYAVKIGDTDMQAFSAASNKLAINMGKNAEAFEKMGISAKDPVEAFKQLADVFSSIEDPQKIAAFGAATLGKSYAEMAPLLVMGADGIQQLIDKGREHNPVTAEQARLAGEFNDKLEEMSNRSLGFRSSFALGVLGPLASYAEEIDKAIGKSGVLLGTLEGLSNGFSRFVLSSNGAGGGLTKELDDINVKIAEAKQTLKNNTLGPNAKGGQPPIAIESEKKLNALLSDRKKLIEDISNSRRKDENKTNSEASTFDANLEEFIRKGKASEDASDKATKSTGRHAAAIKSSVDVQNRHAEAIAKTIEQLNFEISLTGQSADTQRLLTEIRSATADASAVEDAAIEQLIKAKYDLIEADGILADGEKLALTQRQDSAAEFQRLTQLYSGDDLNMNKKFGDAFDARNSGIISDDELARSLENISQGYDAVTGKAKNSSDQMSEYAIQAARNMQSGFADFLFDPFDQGMSGMLEGFGNTVRRMAADAASAQLMESLFGQTGKKDGGGLLGTLFGAVAGGVGSYFGGGINADVNGLISTSGLFANGGIMTSSGPVSLNTYASGGIANSPQLALFGEGRTNEAYVPLPDGKSIPVTMQGSGGGTYIYDVSIHVQGGSNPDETGRKVGEAFIRTIARQEIQTQKRPGGMLS